MNRYQRWPGGGGTAGSARVMCAAEAPARHLAATLAASSTLAAA
jgi:hypothetical protein